MELIFGFSIFITWINRNTKIATSPNGCICVQEHADPLAAQDTAAKKTPCLRSPFEVALELAAVNRVLFVARSGLLRFSDYWTVSCTVVVACWEPLVPVTVIV